MRRPDRCTSFYTCACAEVVRNKGRITRNEYRIYFLTRDVWVWASDRAMMRHVLRKLRPEVRHDRAFRTDRHRILREALKAHHDHQQLCRKFRI